MDRVQTLLKSLLTFLPLLAMLFLLYWLEYSGTWTLETPHRGKISVLILSLGLGLSFLVFTWLFDRRKSVTRERSDV
ncbi:MAG: hypothetical protein AAF529_25145 [Pseudomonadota bacterium]